MATVVSLEGKRKAPSLEPLLALCAEDMVRVDREILVRMRSPVALIPELATLGPFGAGELAVYRHFEQPEPTRDLALVWRHTFPRGDSLHTHTAWRTVLIRQHVAGMADWLTPASERR